MLRSEDVGSAWFYKSLGRREAVTLSHTLSKWPDLCLTPNATGTGHSSFCTIDFDQFVRSTRWLTRIYLGHCRNIQRYRQLPATSLTELEREYIAKRLVEGQSVIETLFATMLPHLLEDPVVSSRIRVQPDRQSC